MVKPFFFGIGVVMRATVSASAVLVAARLSGVAHPFGGRRRLPFHAPIPHAAADTVHSWLARVTPAVWLAAALGLVALALVSVVGTLVALLVRRWTEQRQQVAEVD